MGKTAADVIALLVSRGVLPQEYEATAVAELDRELSRRARRLSQSLAAMAFLRQLAARAVR